MNIMQKDRSNEIPEEDLSCQIGISNFSLTCHRTIENVDSNSRLTEFFQLLAL